MYAQKAVNLPIILWQILLRKSFDSSRTRKTPVLESTNESHVLQCSLSRVRAGIYQMYSEVYKISITSQQDRGSITITRLNFQFGLRYTMSFAFLRYEIYGRRISRRWRKSNAAFVSSTGHHVRNNVWCLPADGCLEKIIGFLRSPGYGIHLDECRLCKACFEYRSRVNGQPVLLLVLREQDIFRFLCSFSQLRRINSFEFCNFANFAFFFQNAGSESKMIWMQLL